MESTTYNRVTAQRKRKTRGTYSVRILGEEPKEKYSVRCGGLNFDVAQWLERPVRRTERPGRCDKEETLPYVLGFCHPGELLRINRHSTVRSLIAASIRQNASYEVYEEVGCASSDGSTRRANIIIIHLQEDKAVILDSKIRFEMHEQQPQEVCREKKSPHTAHGSMNCLRNMFPGRIISRFGDIAWPPRSPDLTAADYFLWVISKVGQTLRLSLTVYRCGFRNALRRAWVLVAPMLEPEAGRWTHDTILTDAVLLHHLAAAGRAR
ncbi:hypothetical protein ANN_11193 [Periplaneta americana]|uniref:Uncharacterized protein n=1 Tax=Periplaneta americana TaxID=6978 RepID=A0ABQ8T525_PERAM|nr:hypothetical protein ANN_11193 [Periplaneta americana]